MATLPTLRPGDSGHYVKLLQMNLNGLSLNYNGFVINGYYDKKTEDVLKNFQDRFKLNRNGIVGPKTWYLLTSNVKAVQRLLNARDYSVGHVDGWYGASTTHAVRRFQQAQGLHVTGIVNPRTRQKLFNPNNRDHFERRPTSLNIDSLHPGVAAMARRFLQLAHQHHIDARITTAFRSWDEQDRLYAKGRTTPGHTVTNAQGGNSYHNWGLAFDAAPFENGKISNDVAKYKQLGKIGEQVGLEWGGTFKSITDYPHYQYTYGLNTWDLLNGVRPRS